MGIGRYFRGRYTFDRHFFRSNFTSFKVTNLVEDAKAWGIPQALNAVFMTSPPFH